MDIMALHRMQPLRTTAAEATLQPRFAAAAVAEVRPANTVLILTCATGHLMQMPLPVCPSVHGTIILPMGNRLRNLYAVMFSASTDIPLQRRSQVA